MTCYKCNKKLRDSNFGIDKREHKFCYTCCAENDKQAMRKDKKIMLYLHKENVTNWPGTLKFKAYIREGKHNIARVQRSVYFTFEGKRWYGRQFGDFSELCYCKELKK